MFWAYLTLGLSSFVKVFLSGIQSKNIQHSRVLFAVLISSLMAAADIVIIKSILSGSLVIVYLVTAIANSSGIALAITLHDRVRR